MAQKVNITLVDDIDGSNADETVSFAIDGKAYEIDLAKKNAAKLRDALAPYVVGGRRTTGRSRRSPGPSRDRASGIRAWAQENGYKVSGRGRLPAEVVEAYNAVH